MAGRDANNGVPTAGRIAEILRSHDAWRKAQERRAAAETPLDFARRLVSQQRAQLSAPEQASQPVTYPDVVPLSGGAALSTLGASPADLKLGHLAERVSVLIAGIQQQCDIDKQDFEQRLGDVASSLDTRARAIEARLSACEEQDSKGYMGVSDHDRRDVPSRTPPDEVTAMVVREARVVIHEAQGQWQRLGDEIQNEQREQLRHLEELASQFRHVVGRVDEVERGLEGQSRALEASRRHLQALDDQVVGVRAEQKGAAAVQQQHRDQAPCWFGQSEGAIGNVDRRLEEQRAGLEVQVERLRTEVDSVRRKVSGEGMRGWKEDVLRAVEGRLEEEVERVLQDQGCGILNRVGGGGLQSGGHSQVSSDANQRDGNTCVKNLTRRHDDTEAKIAALRIRLDSHDGRFATMSERTETLCQQAIEDARAAGLSQRQEIIQEMDCQTRILQQRIETLSEMSEEHALRHATKNVRPPGAIHQQD